MKVDSLDELQSAFASWRKTKKYRQEAIPERLLARARRCASKHGIGKVTRAVGVDSSRLGRGQVVGEVGQALSSRMGSTSAQPTPGYSRLELGSPSVERLPIVELDTNTGVKLRLFEQTPEMLGLLGALCGIGGTR